MKKLQYILPVIFIIGLFSCNPLDQMDKELADIKGEDLASMKENDVEDWEIIEKDLQKKESALTKMKSRIVKLEELIDSLKGQGKEDLQLVNATLIAAEKFESYVKVHGVVATDKNITVVPEGSGVIRKILVKRGSSVRAGQVLAYLDTEVINKNIKELEKSLEFATTLFDKQKRLFDQNVGTEVQYLESKNRKESLEQSIQTLHSQKSKNTITSPISGKIDEIFPNVGEMASQMSPFARIVNTNNVYVESDLSEAFINKVNIGDSVLIDFPYSDKEIAAKITYKSNFINPNNRTFKIQAAINGMKGEIAPNMLTVMRFKDVNYPSAIVVNNTAIYTDFNGDFVYVLDKSGKNYKTVKTPVDRAETYQNRSVIKHGLKPNDLLVTQRYQTLDNGDVVELKK